MKTKVSNLQAAKKNKNDEFYTQLSDIENELKHYRPHFKNKIVYCNCDDPEWSNFWKFFSLNFEFLGLKKLISTHYEADKPSYKLEITGYKQEPIKTILKQNGDFRSPEAIELLKEADIVVTNPPFSLFREYISQLVEHNKKFLIMGNMNAVKYKETFKLIMNNRVWLGYGNPGHLFRLNDTAIQFHKQIDGKKYANVSTSCWFTNLEHNKRNEELDLYEKYTKEKFPCYDNYPDIIVISKTKEIPQNYFGKMGVPISFLFKWNPKQFEIINTDRWSGSGDGYLNGKSLYTRIIIKRIK